MISVIYYDDKHSIVTMDSAVYMNDSQKGNIVLCGSHGGESAARYMLKFSPGAAIFNDGGKGKENAGIKGLDFFEKAGIPAATVDNFSARIGDGTDTYESGIISVVNNSATQFGIKTGMTAKEAALIIKQKLVEKNI